MRVFQFSRLRLSATFLAGVLGLLSSAAWTAAPAKPVWLSTFTLSSVGGHIIGNAAAKTQLIEYASYTCGHCGHFEVTEAPQLKAQYIAGGEVSFEIRHLVRDEMDLTAAMLARCGGKGRFFGNHKHLMATQAQWADDSKISSATYAKFKADDLFGYMLGAYTELGLDKIMKVRGVTVTQAKRCLTDANALNQLLAMTDEATGPLGMKGTPTFMVNGKVIEAYDLETLKPFLTH